MSSLRIIGDVHGKSKEYLALVGSVEHSIQLGDLDLDYDFLDQLDAVKHRAIGGNHDNYELKEDKFHKQPPHFLGNYGVFASEVGNFFYVRGGRSIDRYRRIEGYDWWPDEELKYSVASEALEEYLKIKPDLMLSHECPAEIVDMIHFDNSIRPSMTSNLLQRMFEFHKPKLWLFGHHHRSFDEVVDGTRFICLPELGYIDFSKKELDVLRCNTI